MTVNLRKPKGLFTGKSLLKGKPYRRILGSKIIGGREWSYHATKGWRSRRA